jgi:AraC family transcriptional regulator, regulatory protein of adaptative response / methylated-DNA-[protein]-cysteine methyltransferase
MIDTTTLTKSEKERFLAGTLFQRAVWSALCSIPRGKVVSYSMLAVFVGKPRAVRAVASAVGANTIYKKIPCHRVVRASGCIGAYRWGIPAKRALLKKEGVCIDPDDRCCSSTFFALY